MTLIHLATLNRTRPSDLLDIDDPYTAYCLDEACLFMVHQAREGKEPDFNRPARPDKNRKRETTNSGSVEVLASIGVKLDN